MSGGEAGTYHALLDRQDWAALGKKLKLFAFLALGKRSMSDAEDLAQEAIARVYESPGARWDPDIQPDIFNYLSGLVRGELSNQSRKKRDEPTDEETLKAYDDDGEGSPELLFERRQTTHVVFTAFKERTSDDPIGATVAELFSRGIDAPAEQAAQSGHSIDDIRRARRRVFDHAAAIRRELGTDSEVT